MSQNELVTQIREVVGLSASLPGYRRELPKAADELRYKELWGEIDSGLAQLRVDAGVDLLNPNPHRTLTTMWAWIWSESGGGKERMERPTALYADLISKLQLMDVHEGTAAKRAGCSRLAIALAAGETSGACVREQEVVSLLFFDLDGFKAVNDQRGHPEGDRCLDTVVAGAQSVARNRRQLYRYGGDEFVVLLPNATLPEAVATAERLRLEIERIGSDFGVTASIGVVCSSEEGLNDVPAVLSAADEAAYVSKFSGKNRATTWPVNEIVREEIRQRRIGSERR